MNVDFCLGKGRGGLHLEWILRDVLRWQTPELAKRTFYEFTVPSLPSMWKSGSFTLESMAPGLAGVSYLIIVSLLGDPYKFEEAGKKAS